MCVIRPDDNWLILSGGTYFNDYLNCFWISFQDFCCFLADSQKLCVVKSAKGKLNKETSHDPLLIAFYRQFKNMDLKEKKFSNLSKGLILLLR